MQQSISGREKNVQIKVLVASIERIERQRPGTVLYLVPALRRIAICPVLVHNTPTDCHDCGAIHILVPGYIDGACSPSRLLLLLLLLFQSLLEISELQPGLRLEADLFGTSALLHSGDVAQSKGTDEPETCEDESEANTGVQRSVRGQPTVNR